MTDAVSVLVSVCVDLSVRVPDWDWPAALGTELSGCGITETTDVEMVAD